MCNCVVWSSVSEEGLKWTDIGYSDRCHHCLCGNPHRSKVNKNNLCESAVFDDHWFVEAVKMCVVTAKKWAVICQLVTELFTNKIRYLHKPQCWCLLAYDRLKEFTTNFNLDYIFPKSAWMITIISFHFHSLYSS